VLHGDLKPGNMLFDEQGSVYLSDFAITTAMRAGSSLTTDSMLMDTPAYVSPEQWRGGALSAATDQYSFGILVYQMITGKPPFDAATPYALGFAYIGEGDYIFTKP
jgi:serine/threonine protein kinase